MPKEALDVLGEVVSGGSEADKADLATLLSTRLQEPSISVKLKVLRVIIVLAGKGGQGFAEHLRTNTLAEMQSHTEFQAPPDPKHGEKPKLMIRAAAVRCIRTMEEKLVAPQPTAEDPLAAAVQQLTTAVQRMEAKSTALEDRFAGLEAWLADVEDKLAAAPAPAAAPVAVAAAPDPALERLEADQTAAAARVEQLAAASTGAGDRLSAVEQQLAAVVAELGKAQASVGAVGESLSYQGGETTRRLAEQQESVEALLSDSAGMGSRLSTLETSHAASVEAAVASVWALKVEVARDVEQLRAAATPAPAAAPAETAPAVAAAASSEELVALKGQLLEIDERLSEQESLVSVVDETATKTEEDLSRLVAEQESSINARVAECVDRAVSSLQPQPPVSAPAPAPDTSVQAASVTMTQFSEWSDLQSKRVAALEQQVGASVADLKLTTEKGVESSGAINTLDEKVSTHQQSVEAAVSNFAGLTDRLATLETLQASSTEAATASLAALQADVTRDLEHLRASAAPALEEAIPEGIPGADAAAGSDELVAIKAQLDEYQGSIDARVVEKVHSAITSLKGVCVGDRCEVNTEGCRGNGTVGYAGRVDGKEEFYLGIDLDEASGRNDGLVQGRRYFQCAQGHGVFVPPDKVRKIPVSEAMATALEEERGLGLATINVQREERLKDQEVHAALAQRFEAHVAEARKRSADAASINEAMQSQLEEVKAQVTVVDAAVTSKIGSAVEDLDMRLSEQEGLVSVVDELATKLEEDLATSVSAMEEQIVTQKAAESELRAQITALSEHAAPEAIHAKVTATVESHGEGQSQQFAVVDAEVKRLGEAMTGYATAEQVSSAESKAEDRLRALAALVDSKIETVDGKVDSKIATVDGKIEEANATLDVGQDAVQQRIDVVEQWVQRVETKASVAEAATAQGTETTQALGAHMKGLVDTEIQNRTEVLKSLAKGIKTQLDAVTAETEATEGKVLELLKKHIALSEQKMQGVVGREEFDRYSEDTDERCTLLEERTETVLGEARSQREAAEGAMVELQQTLASQSQAAERQSEPLTIRVSTVEVRYADGKSSKP